MFTYEAGLVLALLLWILHLTMIIVSVNSRFEKNLNKVGMRMSWLTLTPNQLDGDYKNGSPLRRVGKFALIAGVNFPFIFSSWLYVFLVVVTAIYNFSKAIGKPQALKEFQWRLKNVDMTFDQIVKEMLKSTDEDPASFEQAREDLLQELQGRGVL